VTSAVFPLSFFTPGLLTWLDERDYFGMPGARIHHSRRLKGSQPVQSGAKKRRCETVAAIGVSGALGDDKDEACANDWQPMIPDRHGNNRLDGLKNIVEDPAWRRSSSSNGRTKPTASTARPCKC
jgi:hypothetical protein